MTIYITTNKQQQQQQHITQHKVTRLQKLHPDWKFHGKPYLSWVSSLPLSLIHIYISISLSLSIYIYSALRVHSTRRKDLSFAWSYVITCWTTLLTANLLNSRAVWDVRARGYGELRIDVGWNYLSDATCLMRPHLFCACFVVSRVTMICYIIRNFWRSYLR